MSHRFLGVISLIKDKKIIFGISHEIFREVTLLMTEIINPIDHHDFDWLFNAVDFIIETSDVEKLVIKAICHNLVLNVTIEYDTGTLTI